MSNEVTISQFLDEIKVPVKRLTITQLRQREETWRALWSWLDPTVKDFLTHAGTMVRVVRRNYQGSVGELGEVKFEPKRLDLYVYEKNYNYNDGKYYWERKTQVIDSNALLWWEFITEQSEASEVETYEVEPIPEEEGVV